MCPHWQDRLGRVGGNINRASDLINDPNNFDAEKFVPGGSGLHDHIRHCGEISIWNFRWLTSKPNGMQWYAEGNQAIGTKSCFGSAVVDTGGKTPDGCTGAG